MPDPTNPLENKRGNGGCDNVNSNKKPRIDHSSGDSSIENEVIDLSVEFSSGKKIQAPSDGTIFKTLLRIFNKVKDPMALVRIKYELHKYISYQINPNDLMRYLQNLVSLGLIKEMEINGHLLYGFSFNKFSKDAIPFLLKESEAHPERDFIDLMRIYMRSSYLEKMNSYREKIEKLDQLLRPFGSKNETSSSSARKGDDRAGYPFLGNRLPQDDSLEKPPHMLGKYAIEIKSVDVEDQTPKDKDKDKDKDTEVIKNKNGSFGKFPHILGKRAIEIRSVDVDDQTLGDEENLEAWIESVFT